MITIKEVKTKSQQRQFVDFPTKLYKSCENYVHPLRIDEMKLFNKKNVYYKDCEAVYYLAYKDNKIVGRIAGILQNAYNQKVNEKRVRFTRFDSIDDIKVAKALFNTVENWAKINGMNCVHGPLGFNDLDREGLLVEGFDYLATFEEQYNFDYYPRLIEKCGYSKEVDWLEYRLFPPKEVDKRVERLSGLVLKRFNLKIANEKSKRRYIKKYKEGIFNIIDEAYGPLYGTVPFTDELREQIINQFKLFLKLKYIVTILDKNEEVVAFGFVIPSLSDAVRKSKGRLFPFGIFRLLNAIRHVKRGDFGLIGMKESYMNKGLPAVVISEIMKTMIEEKLEYCETNLMLEDNLNIQQIWDNYNHIQHKRRRCYIKSFIKKPKNSAEEKKVSALKSKTKLTKKAVTNKKTDKKTGETKINREKKVKAV